MAKSVAGGSADAEDRSPRPRHRSGRRDRGAGLLLPGVLPLRVSGVLRSRRVRSEPASGRVPVTAAVSVATAVSGAGPAAAAPDRRRISARTLRAPGRRHQDGVPVGLDPEAAASAAGRGPAAAAPDHALADRDYSAASRYPTPASVR